MITYQYYLGATNNVPFYDWDTEPLVEALRKAGLDVEANPDTDTISVVLGHVELLLITEE